MLIKITLGDNLKRTELILDESSTLKTAIEQAGIDYSHGVMHLDGSSLGLGDLEKTFANFGIKEHCYLLNVIKADNGLL